MITGRTRIAAVLGWPVEHSRSPQMLNAAFAAANLDAVMVPMAVPPERLADAIAGLRATNMLGASVTVPHKIAVAALCDELAPAARAIGAVNCLQLDERGTMIGHNTDAPGFVDGLVAAGCEARRAVVLGAGGAARAVAYGLSEQGGSAIVIARRPDAVTWTTARPWTAEVLRAELATAELVVDCTDAGLAGDLELPLDALAPGAWVASLVYHRSTGLLERAARRGNSTVDGRAMLVHQGARAFAIWTNSAAPVGVMERALAAALTGT